MIAVIYGTTGELIKLAPLMAALEAEQALLSLCTAQQATQIEPMLRDFGLSSPDLWMAHGHKGQDLDSARQIPGWVTRVAWSACTKARSLLRQRASLVVVHGDTFTTVLGALAGRFAGLPVAHIEAGLRSGDWRNPFPEEINRRITSRLARIHFTPGQWATDNLLASKTSGQIVNIGANTVRDSLNLVTGAAAPIPASPATPFGIVSIHRFELLRDHRALTDAIDVIVRGSEQHRLIFVDHPVTVAALREARLDRRVDESSIERVPRQGYAAFVRLMGDASFLVSDSGGSQEECAALGLPCAIHRAKTERLDGLDSTVMLTGLDPGALEQFLANPPRRRSAAGVIPSPTGKVIEYLRQAGYLA